jgi:hypothetical protein
MNQKARRYFVEMKALGGHGGTRTSAPACKAVTRIYQILPEPTQTARKAAICSKTQQGRAIFLLFVRFQFGICRDLPRLVPRFYYGTALNRAACQSYSIRKNF